MNEETLINSLVSGRAWLGTMESAQDADKALRAMADPRVEKPKLAHGESERPIGSQMYSRIGRVGVVLVSGPLVSAYHPFNQFFGVTSYDEVRGAANLAAEDMGTDRWVLVANSGGGEANGCEPTHQFLKKLQEVKPFSTYANGAMCSAMLWLGAAGEEMSASPTATVGSIGVILPVLEYTRKLDQEGVTAHVLRSGEFKAPGHPLEVLTDERKALIQASLDEMSAVFHESIAAAVGVTVAEARSTFGEGRTFVGRQAVAVGLISRVCSLTELIETLDSSKVTGSTKENPQTRTLKMEHDTEIKAAAQVDLLKTQLADAQGETLSLKIAAAKAEADQAADKQKVSALETLVTSMSGIVRGSLDTMRIALALPGMAVDTPAQDLVAAHATTLAQFATKFPVGGVSVPPSPSAPSGDTKLSTLSTARVKAVL